MKTITALLMATLIMCPCSSIMAKNPAASVTDKAQKASISTIKDLDNGRLYVMDYTADYKLDKMLQQNINSVDTMLAFVGRELLGAAKPAPGALTPAAVPSPDARKKASLSTDATLTIK